MKNVVRLSEVAVLQRIQSYEPYAISKISPAAIAVLQGVALTLPEVHARICAPLLKMVECFLCLTGKTIECDARGTIRVGTLYTQIVGALASERFWEATVINRYTYIRAWNALIQGVDDLGLSAVRRFYLPSSTHVNEEIAALVVTFEKSKVDAFEAFCWRSSQLADRKGNRTWIPLKLVAMRYGQDFAEFIHSACAAQVFSKGPRVIEINIFLTFLLSLPAEYDAEAFRSSSAMSKIWKKFKHHFVLQGLGIGNYEIVCNSFGIFRNFALTYLDGKGPFGLATWHLTRLPRADSETQFPNTGLDENGTAVAQKLLVDVPLEVTDTDALNIIFVELESRVHTIERWARQSVDDIWSRHLRRIGSGVARKSRACVYGVTTFTKANFARMAAKFNKSGYSPELARTFARPLGDAAFHFGLPQTGALLPHMALLVIAHPLLTPSFFDNCELYDKHGHLNGLIESDNGPILQGHKFRRGPKLAQQVVHLTPATFELVKQIIALTTPLRDYLKEQGDDNWRKLFLTCGQGFGYPKGVKSTGLTADKFRVRALEEEFVSMGLVPSHDARAFVKRFSLISLRATAAVLSYIENPDLGAFAKRLGHAEFNWQLMSRYMPAPLLAFFQERWVRLFQHAIIATAMQGSHLELRATGFDTMEQLHEFLKNHALKLHPRSAANDLSFTPPEKPNAKNTAGETDAVVFGVTVENLTMLLSLSLAVEESTVPVGPIASYWSDFGRRLVGYIDSTDENSVDLHDLLARARVLATPEMVRESIYA